jgi:CubicO group peptidase (beta-lactamase class C family)
MADSDGPQGLETAACCVNATLRDYARFGLLFLNNGNWKCRQIVPEQWVEEATNPQRSQVRSGQVLPGTPLGYGYLWWTLPSSDHVFGAWGLYQQFIYVNPTHGVVIVKPVLSNHTTTRWKRSPRSKQSAAPLKVGELLSRDKGSAFLSLTAIFDYPLRRSRGLLMRNDMLVGQRNGAGEHTRRIETPLR